MIYIERFITVLSILFILHVLFTSGYLLTGKKYKKLTRDNGFILTRFFQHKQMTWKLFCLSVLWVIIYYFDFIKELLKGFING